MKLQNDSQPSTGNGEPARGGWQSRSLIRASAGAGKTFRLSNRYLSILRRCPAERILAVTFTRKAAAEIFDRILLRLAEAATDAAKLKELAGFLGPPELTRDECLELLTSITRNLHRVRIGTLDWFFSRLGSSFALDFGLPPNWQILDEHADREIKLRAVDAVLREGDAADVSRLVHLLAKGEIPRGINKLIEDAVTAYQEIARVTSQAAWSRIEPPPLVASEELAELEAAFEALEIKGNTRLMDARAIQLGIIRRREWESLSESTLAKNIESGQETYNRKQLPDDFISLYRRFMNHAKGMLLRVWSDQNLATFELMTRFAAARGRLLFETQGVHFGDISAALSRRMGEVDSRTLAHRLDADLEHLLLDEFQDTSLMQWQILEPFVNQVAQQAEGSFFCVGDVKQAIFGWRGGVAALFDKVAASVKGIEESQLNESRRSSQPVIDAVNQVFANLDQHPDLESLQPAVKEWSNAFPIHETAQKDLSGYVTLRTIDQLGLDAEGNRLACAASAADLVAEALEQAPHATIGVLTQKNTLVARVMYELGERGIPASEEGGVPLTNSAAVQLVQSALLFADHPGHSIARFHIAHSPIGAHYGVKPQMSDRDANAASLRMRRDLTNRGYEAVMKMWADWLRPLCNRREWLRLQKLCSLAARDQRNATLRPGEFAERIERERVEDASGSRVRVMTYHKSKGLEFDVVILPDLDFKLHQPPSYNACGPGPADPPDTVLVHRNQTLQGLLPKELLRAFENQLRSDVQETLCVLYVAMTRARHALHMVIAPQVVEAGKTIKLPKSPSGLLRATLVERQDAPSSMVLYEHGDREWFRSFEGKEAHPEPDRVEKRPLRLAPMTDGRRRGRDTVAPSQAKSMTISGEQLLLRETSAAIDRGTLWHAWLESITWLEGAPDGRAMDEIATRLDLSREDVASQREPFCEAVGRGEVAGLFERSRYGAEAECFNERRFSIVEEGRHFSGTIDRLVLRKEQGRVVAAEIVDFKTDAAGAKSSRRTYYQEQLRLYAKAVGRAHGLPVDRIRCRLAWLMDGVVEDVGLAG
jgi:ATP-dependent exoDNAse (exonuclease V) beta subunit